MGISDVPSSAALSPRKTRDAPEANPANGAPGRQSLGKDAFLKLLVTQLNNQNPLDPQDNSSFVAQLAQFSTLEGITTLNNSVSAIAGSYKSSQTLLASSLIGRSVVVQTGTTLVDTSKSMTGSVAVPSGVKSVTVTITDKDGKTVKTLELGNQKAGNASFVWDGTRADGTKAPPGTYTFKASTTIDGKGTSLVTYLPARVNSVTVSQTGGELMLNLAGISNPIGLSKIRTIGI
ncbi:flagellar hook assembly protein FlgD [Pseudomonas sp. CMR5c]|uniref:flagellar hook assembly protein FlgD n=1 Tax=Pseudomonas sp. CMR5c TaxID=658630 RepID=UPI00069FE338|nr:flagellar hook assembly protein FlgD [Pseudomonas sp. CMR5c]ALG76240.1 flagellar basal body rod modification protein FlgD [Pseudomonas sp. CMR5c]AZC17626.1 Flagellar basal-body rod modification protein FlgD [Pseudomonas sp. CMR5c]